MIRYKFSEDWVLSKIVFCAPKTENVFTNRENHVRWMPTNSIGPYKSIHWPILNQVNPYSSIVIYIILPIRNTKN